MRVTACAADYWLDPVSVAVKEPALGSLLVMAKAETKLLAATPGLNCT